MRKLIEGAGSWRQSIKSAVVKMPLRLKILSAAHTDGQSKVIGKFLQFIFPCPQAIAIRAATNDDEVGFGVGFAGNAAVTILFQAGVQHGIGDGITDFVGMAFADGFGGKDEVFAHV